MNDTIRILDCTLRDGGYINNWAFKNEDILLTINGLLDANIDIIECGFLDNINGKLNDSTRFESFECLNAILSHIEINNKLLVAMIEHGKYDIKTLPKVDDNTKIKGLRYSFRKSNLKDAISNMSAIIKKGYKLFVQPISTVSYNQIELNDLINIVNNLQPYAIYIVDTQGSMFQDDFRTLYYQFDKVIKKNISIGFHSHNNMQLSYSISIDFIGISNNRKIIIDSSIYGMGRGAGNLNTELLSDYINKKNGKKYNMDNILELVDKLYYYLFTKKNWGYSLVHFLSASLGCHPDYASYLLSKKHLNINKIKYLLSEIKQDNLFEYNKKVIEELYFKYSLSIKNTTIELSFDSNKKILLLGSGSKANSKVKYLKENKNIYTIIALNHAPLEVEVDYIFFNNKKRFDSFDPNLFKGKIIASSNIYIKCDYILNYKKLISIGDSYNDNSAVMLINYFCQLGISSIYLIGIDGFNMVNNYSYHETDSIVDKNAIDEINSSIMQSLRILNNKININFLTDSIYKSKLKLRIIGVIPARISSTRLPKKPLKDICGLPMVVHVMKRAKLSKILDTVIVATDSQDIIKVIESYGGTAILTSSKHQNGTLRMQEVARKIDGDIFVLLNGDEPLINPEHIEKSVTGLINAEKAVASLLVTEYKEQNNQTNFKVVMNIKDEIMYISRNDIPSDARNKQQPMWKAVHIISYRKDFLDKYSIDLKETELENREMHENLRILENGYTIKAVKVNSNSISVDTQQDLEVVRNIMNMDNIFQIYK